MQMQSALKTLVFHHPQDAPEQRVDPHELREHLFQSFPLAPASKSYAITSPFLRR